MFSYVCEAAKIILGLSKWPALYTTCVCMILKIFFVKVAL